MTDPQTYKSWMWREYSIYPELFIGNGDKEDSEIWGTGWQLNYILKKDKLNY